MEGENQLNFDLAAEKRYRCVSHGREPGIAGPPAGGTGSCENT